MKIAFLGLGKMGAAIVGHLLDHGDTVTVWNRSAKLAKPFADRGALVADSAVDAVKGADVVFTMLLNDRAYQETIFESGAIDWFGKETVHASLGTLSMTMAGRLQAEHTQRGHWYVGSPVFGRPNVAEEGNLWVVLGGEAPHVDKVKPLIERFSRGQTLVGDRGVMAHFFKLTGNFMIAAMIGTMAEATVAAQSMNIDPTLFLETINSALFQSKMYENYGKTMLNPPKEAGATVEVGIKDVGSFLEATRATGVETPIAELMKKDLDRAAEEGGPEQDWASGHYAAVKPKKK